MYVFGRWAFFFDLVSIVFHGAPACYMIRSDCRHINNLKSFIQDHQAQIERHCAARWHSDGLGAQASRSLERSDIMSPSDLHPIVIPSIDGLGHYGLPNMARLHDRCLSDASYSRLQLLRLTTESQR